MKKNKRPAIDKFFASKKYAIAGVSRNPHKFGTAIVRELAGKNIDVVGVNPHMTEVEGKPCFAAVSDLPGDVDALITTVKPEVTLSVVQAAYEKGIANLWMQQGSQSDEAIAFAESKGMNVIYKECVMMYCEPVESIHKFHRGMKKLFGGYHK
ncbi:CoA-binding protein [Spirochaeta isovalerica]|uniref:CoA-binding domain-containing protein n=1 Tax=Spirochaeta isovalerica TaxID=150 RepID=A0A841RF21_9SPIO|nr:CoA-binding protein [Spirochaeta isovalerica]MBB6482675.1 hypothetical protein [Spirochaeta isovalerica]